MKAKKPQTRAEVEGLLEKALTEAMNTNVVGFRLSPNQYADNKMKEFRSTFESLPDKNKIAIKQEHKDMGFKEW